MADDSMEKLLTMLCNSSTELLIKWAKFFLNVMIVLLTWSAIIVYNNPYEYSVYYKHLGTYKVLILIFILVRVLFGIFTRRFL